ncbi:MAG TPA: ATP-binding protein [Terriglobales bacterium]|jgi:signal transduction histidine kinase
MRRRLLSSVCESAACGAIPLGAGILLFPLHLSGTRLEWAMAVYALPLLAAGLVVMLVLWRLKRQEVAKLAAEVHASSEHAQQLERERDLAQEELFRRLYEERELAKEKTQFQAQLAEYEKYAALAQLALGAAHEINNPLLGILSHLELELKHASGEEKAEIEQCIDGARRISSTLKGLLNYARPGPLVLSKISLQRLVADTLAFLENQPMMRSKHLENTVPSDLPFVRADANQISQVLMNLLLNAAQATPEGGRISVSASKLQLVEMIEIRISDTGCGISADILPHIFEPFFTTKRGKGTGLGLSISQAYVRSHNGEIRVDSVAQHGTTVTITLPIRQEAEAAAENDEKEVVIH